MRQFVNLIFSNFQSKYGLNLPRIGKYTSTTLEENAPQKEITQKICCVLACLSKTPGATYTIRNTKIFAATMSLEHSLLSQNDWESVLNSDKAIARKIDVIK